MVYFFKSRCGNFTIYMGRDKYENEDLIRYGLDLDIWLHVDGLSSAHVYLRLTSDMKIDEIPSEVLLDCASLVKANSIEGCKKSSVYVVYTRWRNLKKSPGMVEGQVGFHRPDNVRRIAVEKNNSIVRAIEKTREERFPDLYQLQQDRLNALQRKKKEEFKRLSKEKEMMKLEREREKHERSYDRIMVADNMVSTADMKATADATAAEEYEEDFF